MFEKIENDILKVECKINDLNNEINVEKDWSKIYLNEILINDLENVIMSLRKYKYQLENNEIKFKTN